MHLTHDGAPSYCIVGDLTNRPTESLAVLLLWKHLLTRRSVLREVCLKVVNAAEIDKGLMAAHSSVAASISDLLIKWKHAARVNTW